MKEFKENTLEQNTQVWDNPNSKLGSRGDLSSTIPDFKNENSEQDETKTQNDTPDKLTSKRDLSDAIPDFRNNDRSEVSYSKGELDDNGQPYKTDGKLLPNCEYEKNGYKYKTDENGRITQASGQLRLTEEPRKPLTENDIGGKDRLKTDDRGHIIGDRFGGSNRKENLVAQDSNLNRGEYKKIENTCAKALEEGKEVSLNVEIEYEKNSERPSAFIVTYKIDGVTYEKVLLNGQKGE